MLLFDYKVVIKLWDVIFVIIILKVDNFIYNIYIIIGVIMYRFKVILYFNLKWVVFSGRSFVVM